MCMAEQDNKKYQIQNQHYLYLTVCVRYLPALHGRGHLKVGRHSLDVRLAGARALISRHVTHCTNENFNGFRCVSVHLCHPLRKQLVKQIFLVVLETDLISDVFQ